ncbi:phosphoribosylformylglycinamidine synthase [Blattabacterium cuenoti]|uniref:phosphoribosylformylglycinamidine synthase n=1 Tax=Blattabacterium cuenoti TaxID=1653831 RepID=UPI00163C49E0|nr:phosphoribosylformylglycinamidine synthase [Blattabacterium cuenoti]
MNFKIFIKKKRPFNQDSNALFYELMDLNIPIKKVIIYRVYKICNVDETTFLESLPKIFFDPVTDIFYQKKYFHHHFPFFSLKDQDRSNAAKQCIKILYPASCIKIHTYSIVELIGIKTKEDVEKSKKYFFSKYSNFFDVINKVDSSSLKKDLLINFIHLSMKELKKLHKKLDLSISFKDLLFIKKYFIQEKRNPKEIEIRILETYWSDHCRHITFFTSLKKIRFNGILKKKYQHIFKEYLKNKSFLGISHHPITLMELSILPSQILYQKGKLKHYCPSNEKNACMMMINVDVDNQREKWYLFFKNETHNHPTEINPFVGAATCLGGAIRDPLSGRSFVYQGIRLSGSANPTNSTTFYDKIPQNKISREAAMGFSSYGNQIGLSTTHVHEIYHEGYRAKRMEIGMVVGASPMQFVKQKTLKKGDIILLIGGLTGKHGIGDATDSSKKNNKRIKKNKINQQKGDPLTERKIQRFFRKKKVTSLIKKCNDFGAGGGAIAIGELHDSIELDLDQIPIDKNQTMNELEISLSESQERMAVVLHPKNVNHFIQLAHEENLMATPIAKITDNKRIIFYYQKKEVFNVKSSFLHTKGSNKKQSVILDSPITCSPFKKSKQLIFNKENFLHTISKLNVASQIHLVEMFDNTVGGTTVLMPFGGKYQMTPSEGSVQKIPVLHGNTNTVSMVSWGFHPDISNWSPFHGGSYAIIECISKIVSMGGDYKNTYLSFQEYYQKLGNNSKTWGIPFASLMGAYHTQMSLEIASIGGKDSMSGSYKNFHVPPTLISFGITTGFCDHVISPEFKKIGNKIYLFHHSPLTDEMPNFESIKNAYNQIYDGIRSKKIISVKTVKDGGISIAIAQMSFGNRLGAIINCKKNLLDLQIGSLIIESSSYLSDDFILIGKVISNKSLIFNDVSIDINVAQFHWLKTLSSVFSFEHDKKEKRNTIIQNHIEKKTIIHQSEFSTVIGKSSFYKGIPRVFIPIFPGTNGEFESIRSFHKVGSIIKTFVFKNMKDKDILNSILECKKYIESTQIIMLCGGFSYGDEPDGSGKFIASILYNPHIQESIHRFLENDGLILGICNGFQSLIKSGLLPYGKICLRNENSPTLTYNKRNKYISRCVHIKILSDKSPWLMGMKNNIYTLPISHGEGRFYAKKNMIKVLFDQNQVASQYVNTNGLPSLSPTDNPNGSVESIEGLLSVDGKIYGRMTHPERCDQGLLKNIPNSSRNSHSIFKNAVQYFM